MTFKLFFNLLFLLTIFSCSNFELDNAVENSSESNQVQLKKLRIMGHWFGEGKKELLVREAVREFSLLNQNYDVQLEFPNHIFKDVEESQLFVAEFDSISKMVKSNIWPWDVLFCDQERYRKVGEIVGDPDWGQKYLVDFSEKDWFKVAHKDGLFETMNFKDRYGKTIPGPILEGITDIMFVSGEVEQKLGITVKDLDMTSDDLLQYAKAVSEYNSSHPDKITFFSTQLSNATEFLFTQLVLSIYGNKESGLRLEGLAALSEAYKFMEALSVYKPIDQYIDNSGMQYDKAQRILYHDKCLFTMQPTWMYLLWANSNPEGVAKMRPCEIPSMNGGVSQYYVGFYQAIFVVPKNAQNPEAAEEFIKFISSAETADKWIKYSKSPTGLKNNISYTEFGQDNFDAFFRHIQKKYGNNQVEIDLSKYLFKSQKVINYRVQEVLRGTLSAKAALNHVTREL